MSEQTRKKILIFDDEQIIGDIACQMLDFFNCDAVHTTTAEATIETYNSHYSEGKSFDAVIMDLNVPGGPGGKEVVKDVLAINKDANVYVSSGDSSDSAMINPEDFGFAGTICKPFDLQAIEKFTKELTV